MTELVYVKKPMRGSTKYYHAEKCYLLIYALRISTMSEEKAKANSFIACPKCIKEKSLLLSSSKKEESSEVGEKSLLLSSKKDEV